VTMPTIREARPDDRAGIRVLLADAFGQAAEADLVEALARDGDAVLELVAELDGRVAGHVLFSRLLVEGTGGGVPAVALAPLAVEATARRRGVAAALVEEGHARLQEAGERLSVVLGEPAYYGRFGYRHERAAGFDCQWQCDALQALVWGNAPTAGRLVYPRAFADL
jgi:putative acetyltransferase